jgi:hypothetical protein
MPKRPSTQTTWNVSKHDTIPSVELWLNPLETHTYLFAFLDAEGEDYTAPYSEIRESVTKIIEDVNSRKRQGQAPRADVSDERIRTWKAVFEHFGFLLVDEAGKKIHLTPLGRAVKELYGTLKQRIEGANDHLAQLAVGTLNRYLLRNPIDGDMYPEDSDLHPFRFMWRAMRQLDDKLHWEELNRVIMRVTYQREEDEAINTIRAARAATGGRYGAGSIEDLLGEPAVSEGAETKRRITPWFTRAGFGGLLISAEDDSQGFRHLTEEYKPLIDEVLQEDIPVPADARSSREAYLRYLSEEPSITNVTANAADEDEIRRVVEAVEKYGSTKLICFSGIPGTGKSRLAKLVAMRIVDNDPYRFAEIQFHESTSYDDFMEGFVPRLSGEGFELLPKTFRTINRRAKLDPRGAPYVLLIEEFTRANVHSVLGELITYVEHRDRPFRLAISQKEETVAPNLVLLATMNPRDKSAVVLDHAILRRLHQLPLDPSEQRLRTMLEGKLGEEILERLVAWYQKYLPILPFGHGVFAAARSAADLQEIWRGTLIYFLTDSTGEVRESYRELAQEYPWR